MSLCRFLCITNGLLYHPFFAKFSNVVLFPIFSKNSVHGGRGCVSQHALGQTPPPRQVSQHALGQTPPPRQVSQHALGQTPLLGRYPSIHWGRPPRQVSQHAMGQTPPQWPREVCIECIITHPKGYIIYCLKLARAPTSLGRRGWGCHFIKHRASLWNPVLSLWKPTTNQCKTRRPRRQTD